MATQARKKRAFTRTTTGCLTCRRRHIKCDELYQLQRNGRLRSGPCLNCQRVNRDCIRRPVERFIVYSSADGDQFLDDYSDLAGNGGREDGGGMEYPVLSPPSLGRGSDVDNSLGRQPSAETDYQPQLLRPVDRTRSTNREYGADLESRPGPPTSESTEHFGTEQSNLSDETVNDTPQVNPLDGFNNEIAASEPRYGREFDGFQWSSAGSLDLDIPQHNTQQSFSQGHPAGLPNLQDLQIPSLTEQFIHPSLPDECLNEKFLSLEPTDPETFRCLHHYITEIGPWNDLWDDQKRFSRLLPREVFSCPPLLAACVAMGAKHLTLTSTFDYHRVLQLYNDAIHRILPVLQVRPNGTSLEDAPESSAHKYTHGQILATLVIMAQFEMSSHSNRTFRDHLRGASRYITHHNLKPNSATGLLEAAFITYARLDAYAAYINLDETGVEPSACHLQMNQPGCASDESWANLGLIIFAEIVNLRSRCWKSGSRLDINVWNRFSERLTNWLDEAPPSYKPLFVCPRPKDTIPPLWYVSSAVISAMQTYHSSWILLLFLKPVSGDALDSYRNVQPETIFHARRILSIASTSRAAIQSIVNGVQACHIAARVIKLQKERKVVIELLKEAERRTGWATRWRVEALREEWGEWAWKDSQDDMA